MNKAVFIDRDGVINSDEGHYYVFRPEDFEINDGIMHGLKQLSDTGYQLIIVTNQGGVAKGEYSEEDVHTVHAYLKDQLRKNNIELTAIYYCPHHNSVSECDCRKPKPGMILQAIEEHQIDAKKSFLIGDSKRDIEAGQKAGLKQCFKIEANASILPACHSILNQTNG